LDPPGGSVGRLDSQESLVGLEDLDLVATFEPRMPRTLGPPRDRALATIALFVGGVMLARAVKDRKLSGRILRACRFLAIPEGTPNAPPP